ncbi:MAG TPA: SRPBCC family protein [Acidimicrobiales bacterium]|nr:SRPBCC family protein [Acidimicrobiales bacterium]
MSTPNRVTKSRKVGVPPAAVFALLSDPRRHPQFDGSGMLVGVATPGPVTEVGDVFSMHMHNENMGDYTIDNHVVEFDPDRRIAWEPVLSEASRTEDEAYIGTRLHHRWGFELEADGPDATLVTEFFDCSASPADFQQQLEGGSIWNDAIAASLENIERQLSAG